jgi:lysozyme
MIHGVDISYWNGDMDFAVLARKAQFVYMRGAYGKAVDTRLAGFVANARAYGMPYGLYHYIKPAYDWKVQADVMIGLIDQYGGQMYPTIDAEEDGGLDKVGLEGWIFKYQRKVAEATGKQMMIYTRAGFWDLQVPLTDWAWKMPLWVANWNAQNPLLPKEWSNHNQDWDFWQYSANKNGFGHEYGSPLVGGGHDIDLNWFNGDAEKFKRLFGVYPNELPEDEIEPPPDELPKWVTVTGNGVNVRNAPLVSEITQVGKLRFGAQLPVTGTSDDGRWWKVELWVSEDWAKP